MTFAIRSTTVAGLLVAVLLGGVSLPALAQTSEALWQSCTTSAQDPVKGVEACGKILQLPGLALDSKFDALINRAVGNYAGKNYNDSIADNTAAIGIKPDSALAYSNRGDGYYSINDYTNAVLDYTSALTRDPSLKGVFQWRANAYFSLGRYGDAIRDFDIALSNDVGNVDMLYDRGRSKSLSTDYAGALEDFDAALAKDASRGAVHYDRAVALHNLRRYEEAQVAYAKAYALDSTLTDAVSGEAGARLDRGDPKGAEELYRKAVTLDAKSAYALTGLANSLMQQDRTLEAIEWFDKAIALGSPTAYSYADRARARIILGQADAAIADASEALKIDAHNGDALYLRGLSLRVKGDKVGAAKDLDASIEASPDYIWSVAARAELLVRDGELVKARPLFDRMIAIAQRDLAGGALNALATEDTNAFLGWAQAMTGEMSQGRTLLDRMIETAKLKEMPLYYRAVLNFLDGDSEAAIADWGKAVEAAPSPYSKAENLFERGRGHEKLGQYADARRDYEAALALMPVFAEARDGVARAKALGAIKPAKAAGVPVLASVSFRIDKTELGVAERAALRKVARAMAKMEGASFIISGQTDGLGDDAYNADLSKRRAEAVRDFLVSVGGLKAEALRIEAVGEATPAANWTERRVIIRRAAM